MRNLAQSLYGRRSARRWLKFAGGVIALYLALTLFLFLGQRRLVYRAGAKLAGSPSDADFQMPYEEVWLSVAGTNERLHAWWIPAARSPFRILSDEPAAVLQSPKTVLYLYGAGRNKGDANYIARVSGLRQLGFSVLVADYRGYGQSEGQPPHEAQFYADSQTLWDYLRRDRGLAPDEIVIYGESLGGAIAIQLASQQPEAAGLIVQSSFTSMRAAVNARGWTRLFPMRWLLTEEFDSLTRVRSLQVPVLFLHGTKDSVMPAAMSEALYAAAPDPKQLFLIPDGDHVRIYQPGAGSYLRAIARFVRCQGWTE
ncbi:MAG: alpha/beta hydrolase [Spirulinaceae cyanobacterium SM2_1_0]|nr:alpha/beta hydrolase [Spirulinaceae cyanobacterium SM2_1_0]